jgi:hypothetical protein
MKKSVRKKVREVLFFCLTRWYFKAPFEQVTVCEYAFIGTNVWKLSVHIVLPVFSICSAGRVVDGID